ncbi:protein C15orf41 homolog, partial [Stegodyphus dumicola]|uniref:protein C15orf41 homolog n=1 Tax=Stegodyphus dumicola TaxID=202533 RepID=UPI0015ABD057
MKLSYYKKILNRYRELKKRDCIEELVAEFADVSEETLENIVFQECQRKTKAKFHVIRSNIEQYYHWYLEQTIKNRKECGFLLKLADEIDFSPALMAKMIFEHHMTSNGKECSKDEISEMLKNTSLIKDLHLGAEISMCNVHDKVYGPISDMWKRY